MENITAHKTSDGQVFEKRSEAESHQADLDRDWRLNALVEATVPYQDNKAMVLDFLREHSSSLREILNQWEEAKDRASLVAETD